MSDDYEVGYGKPPKHAQFKKGQSGNARGRPKGSRNFRTDVKATLDAPVRLTENGQAKTISTQKAALMRLREQALGGDARALDKLIELARLYNDEEMAAAASAALAPDDRSILDNYVGRTLRRDQQPPPTENQDDSVPDNEQVEDDDAWLD